MGAARATALRFHGPVYFWNSFGSTNYNDFGDLISTINPSK